jgi:hypothetical protein
MAIDFCPEIEVIPITICPIGPTGCAIYKLDSDGIFSAPPGRNGNNVVYIQMLSTYDLTGASHVQPKTVYCPHLARRH